MSGPTRRRIAFFLTVIPAILLGITGFICLTWRHFWGGPPLAWLLIPILLAGIFIPLTLLSMRHRNLPLRVAYTVSAVFLGLLSLSFVAAVGCWVAAGAAKLFGFPVNSPALAATLFGAAGVATVYAAVNAAWVRVTRVSVALPNLPSAWQGRTIALVTDMHLGNIRGLHFVRHLVARLRKLQPHAVFISGDMFDGAKVPAAQLVQPWRDLAPPAGIFFVTGNHEEFSDRQKYLQAFPGSGIRVLNNEKTVVDGLQIVGVHDGEAGEPKIFAEILRSVNLDRAQASILLTHQPSNLSIPEQAGISLQLSGHTHRGQFWPGTWIAARVHKQFVYGLNRFGRLLVLTSSGAGTWGPPLRLGTQSEIVVIRLESAGPTAQTPA